MGTTVNSRWDLLWGWGMSHWPQTTGSLQSSVQRRVCCPLLPPSQRRLGWRGKENTEARLNILPMGRVGSEDSHGLQGPPSVQAAHNYPVTSNFSPPLGGQRQSAPSGIQRATWPVKSWVPPSGRVTPAGYSCLGGTLSSLNGQWEKRATAVMQESEKLLEGVLAMTKSNFSLDCWEMQRPQTGEGRVFMSETVRYQPHWQAYW